MIQSPFLYDYVRPDMVTAALQWLKGNSLLYKDGKINEDWVSGSLATAFLWPNRTN